VRWTIHRSNGREAGSVRARRYRLHAIGQAADGALLDTYTDWLADFRRRLALHDAGVDALARDLAERTPWTVRAAGSRRFRRPPVRAGRPPDVFCEVRPGSAICFEVELPETLVRRPTMARLRALSEDAAVEPRVVLVGEPEDHARQIAETERMLRRAGLPVRVAAIAPADETITGADW
jgi:hypothetical protein